jgi:protein-tyrosine phosphatase
MNRQIQLQALPNVRELGGIVTMDGRRIKTNTLLRSGSLNAATAADLDTLRQHGVKQIIDLRTDKELRQSPNPIFEGVRTYHLPILTESTAGITREENAAQDFLQMMFPHLQADPDFSIRYLESLYANFVLDERILTHYAKFMELLLNNPDGATLWHCTAGKDRTGFATLLVLEALGVDRDTILEDYLLTNRCLEADDRALIEKLDKQYNSPELKQGLTLLFTARKEYLETVYQTVEENYGKFEVFLEQGIQMGKDKIEALRGRYLE